MGPARAGRLNGAHRHAAPAQFRRRAGDRGGRRLGVRNRVAAELAARSLREARRDGRRARSLLRVRRRHPRDLAENALPAAQDALRDRRARAGGAADDRALSAKARKEK
ncbi:hypothetical protein BDI4_1040004 [Burkholderia diffusa]|nr:hypothetical protein BDI4_1040004 [Burkholderia diffusa]